MNNTEKNPELERNKAVALRFKKSQGTQDMPAVEKEVLAPNYNRIRGGNFHLAGNARGEGWPEPGMYLRTAFPDRVDVIEHVVAEGDTVGLLFRLTATHAGNLFGIPPTGKKVDVYEVALLRIVNGQMVESWFMMDEAELLRQLGARMPVRKDGRVIAPPVPTAGEDGDALVQRLSSKMPLSRQDRCKVTVARSRSSAPSAADRSPDYRRQREAFQHLHDYGVARGVGEQTLRSALSDRQDRIDRLVAEGDQAWMRFYVHGTHRAGLYGLPATRRRVGVPAAGDRAFRRRQVEGKLVLRRRIRAAVAARRAESAAGLGSGGSHPSFLKKSTASRFLCDCSAALRGPENPRPAGSRSDENW